MNWIDAIHRSVSVSTVVFAVWIVLWGFIAWNVQPLWVKSAAAFVTLFPPAMAWWFSR